MNRFALDLRTQSDLGRARDRRRLRSRVYIYSVLLLCHLLIAFSFVSAELPSPVPSSSPSAGKDVPAVSPVISPELSWLNQELTCDQFSEQLKSRYRGAGKFAEQSATKKQELSIVLEAACSERFASCGFKGCRKLKVGDSSDAVTVPSPVRAGVATISPAGRGQPIGDLPVGDQPVGDPPVVETELVTVSPSEAPTVSKPESPITNQLLLSVDEEIRAQTIETMRKAEEQEVAVIESASSQAVRALEELISVSREERASQIKESQARERKARVAWQKIVIADPRPARESSGEAASSETADPAAGGSGKNGSPKYSSSTRESSASKPQTSSASSGTEGSKAKFLYKDDSRSSGSGSGAKKTRGPSFAEMDRERAKALAGGSGSAPPPPVFKPRR